MSQKAMRFSLHGANRVLERSIPFEALQAVADILPLLNEKPLKFKARGVTVVAKYTNGIPKIITAWKNEE